MQETALWRRKCEKSISWKWAKKKKKGRSGWVERRFEMESKWNIVD